MMTRISSVVASAAVLLVFAAASAYGMDVNGGTVKLPLPGSLSLLVTGGVGLAAASWWLRRK